MVGKQDVRFRDLLNYQIIHLVFSSFGPINSYIHELVSQYKAKKDNFQNFEISLGHT